MNSLLKDLHAAFLSLLSSAQPIPSRDALPEEVPPVPTEPAATAVAAPAPCQILDGKSNGCHLDATVAPDQVVAAARLVEQQGFAIDTITGVDWLATDEMEIVYDFFHLAAPLQVVVRTRVPRARPELPTISDVFPGANWHERETHEFFGIRFLGHPNLTPLLLPEDATYHPLRKDFSSAT